MSILTQLGYIIDHHGVDAISSIRFSTVGGCMVAYVALRAYPDSSDICVA